MEATNNSAAAVHLEPTPADLTKYTIIQKNGCRFNEAVGWSGPKPTASCELYVKNIPRRFKGEDLWPLFERYGRIYHIRVLMDYNDLNRGFAYVTFSTPFEAQLCMELLNYYFVFPGYHLNICRSTDKHRLFANYIPQDVAVAVVHAKFKEIFQEMRDFFMPAVSQTRRTPKQEEGHLHRGFAFLEFESHQEAVAAKKLVYTGVLQIWNAQVKISWARPQDGAVPEDEDVCFYPRLFIRPFATGTRPKAFMDHVEEKTGAHKIVRFDLKNHVGIMKVLSVRDGEKIKRLFRGTEYEGRSLQIDWYRERNTDAKRYCFCKTLELMCTANGWSMPVIVFGRIFEERNQQYVALFTTYSGHLFSIYAKVNLSERMDITSRVAEVFLALVEENGYLPSYNYVLEVDEDTVRVFGFVSAQMQFTRTYRAGDANYCFYWAEMLELNWAVQKLARIDPRYLYSKYQDAIDNSLESEEGHEQYVVEGVQTNNRVFSSVFNDQTNMTLLMMCDKGTQSNKYYAGGAPIAYSTFQSPMCYGKHPQSLTLSSLRWPAKKKVEMI